MYNEVIKKLLQKIEALPEKLVVMYLMKVYKLSQPMALQAGPAHRRFTAESAIGKHSGQEIICPA